jgi:hypothetical protein
VPSHSIYTCSAYSVRTPDNTVLQEAPYRCNFLCRAPWGTDPDRVVNQCRREERPPPHPLQRNCPIGVLNVRCMMSMDFHPAVFCPDGGWPHQ